MSGKQEFLYIKVLSSLSFLIGNEWCPKILTCDFEEAMSTAVKKVFPNTKVVGCYFHLKQAIYKKLGGGQGNLNFSDEQRALILRYIGLLNICEIEDTELVIDFICSKFRDKYLSKDPFAVDNDQMEIQLDAFVKYYHQTWHRRKELWNISRFRNPTLVQTNVDKEHWQKTVEDDDDEVLRGRTNNSAENLNRRGNAMFGVHPKMVDFVACLRQEFEHFEGLMSQAQVNWSKDRPRFVVPKVPDEFQIYVNAGGAVRADKGTKRLVTEAFKTPKVQQKQIQRLKEQPPTQRKSPRVQQKNIRYNEYADEYEENDQYMGDPDDALD